MQLQTRDDEHPAEFPPSTMNSVLVEAVTSSGRSVGVEIRVRVDTVEIWHHEHLAAVFDRDVLSDWLREPHGDLVTDEAEFSVDWLIDVRGRVALTLPDVNAWVLSPAELDALYRRVVIS